MKASRVNDDSVYLSGLLFGLSKPVIRNNTGQNNEKFSVFKDRKRLCKSGKPGVLIMKKPFIVAAAVFGSGSAFAHQVSLNEPRLLVVTNGDSYRASRIEGICASHGKSIPDCLEMVGLGANPNPIQLKAATFCASKFTPEPFKNAGEDEVAEKVGGVWHYGYRPDEKGRMHRHDYSPIYRDDAVRIHQANSIKAAVEAKKEIDDQFKHNDGKSWADSISSTLAGLFGGSSSKESSKGVEWTSLTLGSKEQREIMERAEREAKEDPSLGGREPNLVCYKNEKYCIGSPTPVVNSSYEDPKAKKGADSGESEKKDDSKTASSGTHSAGETPKGEKSDSGDKVDIEHKFAGAYAGNPAPVTKPGEAIASSVDNREEPSIFEECIKATTMIMQ